MDLNKEAVTKALYCTAGLAANLFFCQMGQGKARFPAGERPPEDAGLSMAKKFNETGIKQSFTGEGNADSEKAAKAKENAQRWTRIHMNALENVPLGLITGWATTIAAQGNPLQSIFFIAFVVARWLHTFSYIKGLQPHRALCWLGGWVSIIGMLVTGIKSLKA